ncbi:MAG: EsaB/YukD family protein [Mogibacterium sp.]|nr:EsaB/YukD family protein [Mogibacterium sp.]
MILVDIYVPAVDQTFDFMLDENADLSAVLLEVTEMTAKKTGSERPSDPGAFALYDTDREQPLSEEKTLFESGIRDGDRLILV